MRNILTYAIDTDTGLVVSRLGSQMAWPILDFKSMNIANKYQAKYNLEKISVFDVVGRIYDGLRFTGKIPKELKNTHRVFWGLKPLA